MTMTYYAVACRRKGKKDWSSLAGYPWDDDPSGAEVLRDWLRKYHPIFEYEVAVIQIGDEAPYDR